MTNLDDYETYAYAPGTTSTGSPIIARYPGAMGNGIKEPTKKERENMLVARKSIVASKRIIKGEIFSNDGKCIYSKNGQWRIRISISYCK